MKLSTLKTNKWVSRIFNISYILGLIYAFEKGVTLWYMLITSLVIGILFWKQLWGFMTLGGELYASWCRKTAEKTVNKMNPWKDHVEELKESVSVPFNRTDTTISDVPDSYISGLDSVRCTKNISKHETQCKDKKDHQD